MVLILILLLRGGFELLVYLVEFMYFKFGYVCVLYNIIDKKNILN